MSRPLKKLSNKNGNTLMIVVVTMFVVISITMLMLTTTTFGRTLVNAYISAVKKSVDADRLCEVFVANADVLENCTVGGNKSAAMTELFCNNEDIDADYFTGGDCHVRGTVKDRAGLSKTIYSWQAAYRDYDMTVTFIVPSINSTSPETEKPEDTDAEEVSEANLDAEDPDAEETPGLPEEEDSADKIKDSAEYYLEISKDGERVVSVCLEGDTIADSNGNVSIADRHIIYWYYEDSAKTEIAPETEKAKDNMEMSLGSAARDYVSGYVRSSITDAAGSYTPLDWLGGMLANNSAEKAQNADAKAYKCEMLDGLLNCFLHRNEELKAEKIDSLIVGSTVSTDALVAGGEFENAIKKIYSDYESDFGIEADADIETVLAQLLAEGGTDNYAKADAVSSAEKALKEDKNNENTRALREAKALPDKISIIDLSPDDMAAYADRYFAEEIGADAGYADTELLKNAVTSTVKQLRKYCDELTSAGMQSGQLDYRQNVVASAYQLVCEDGSSKVNYFWGGKCDSVGWNREWGVPRIVTADGGSRTGCVRAYGLDCSGYVTWLFRNAYAEITDKSGTALVGSGSDAQCNNCLSIPQTSITGEYNACPGDMVFLLDSDDSAARRSTQHVGLVVSNVDGVISVIHCTSSTYMTASGPILYDGVVISRSDSGFYPFCRTEVFCPSVYSMSFDSVDEGA